MITQQQFDQFIADYNEDYVFLLTRASRQHYDCLISSFLVLKDLYNVISVLYDSGELVYHSLPYPYSFRGNDQLLKQLGFDEMEIRNIYGFLEYVRKTQDMEFEEVIETGTAAMCARFR
ncbi:MAG TPA: hypothetical protein VLZ81_00370 [Blastocatellia bacterium]|nr:hypothetical protein [Blastocatellia bacterium]